MMTSDALPQLPYRLSKFIRQATGLSHRALKRAYDANRIEVFVDGHSVALTLGGLVFEGDTVMLDGTPLALKRPENYWVLHKPEGVLTSTSDPHDRLSLKPWLDILPNTVFPIGRLDRATTGLLLLCDDGDLAYMLLQPQHHVDKLYHLTIEGAVADDDARLNALRDGVVLGDGPAHAKTLTVLNAAEESSLLALVIDEGRNRQVRRMCKKVRLPLRHLHRAMVSCVQLGDIEPGQMRQMSSAEIEALWRSVGGRDVVARQTLRAFVHRYEQSSFDALSQSRFDRWYRENSPQLEHALMLDVSR